MGSRCGESFGRCAEGLECVSSFAFERGICTTGCNARGVCPYGSFCTVVPDLDGKEAGPYCMRPCQDQADCDDYESVCDAPLGAPVSYCY